MLKRLFNKLLTRFHDQSLPPPNESEQVYLEELVTTFRELPEPEVVDNWPSASKWEENLQQLRELIRNGNPREFLRWDVISRTMFVTFAEYLSAELDYLKACPDWESYWQPAIQEAVAGHPLPCHIYSASSSNLIHHAFHVAQFETETGIKADDFDTVLEFGSGYGSMCRLFHNLGFSGNYIHYHLPEFSALQKYYLRTLGLEVHSDINFLGAGKGIACVSDFMELVALLADFNALGDSLFLATWSISEVPIGIRDPMLPLIAGFKSYLIAYQARFEEVDNVEFFSELQQERSDVTWHHQQIKHLPGSYYLFGTKK